MYMHASRVARLLKKCLTPLSWANLRRYFNSARGHRGVSHVRSGAEPNRKHFCAFQDRKLYLVVRF